jgi:hypothetical protein
VAKGETRELAGPVAFACKPLGLASFQAADIRAKYRWIEEASELSRTIQATMSYASELSEKANSIMQAAHQMPASAGGVMKEAERISRELEDLMFIFNGPRARASQEELPPMELPLAQRLNEMASASYGSSGEIPGIAKDQMEILKQEFPPVLERVRKAGEDLVSLDKKMDELKAPWTPGRIPAL